MDYESILENRNMLINKIKEAKKFENEANNKPVLLFECCSIDLYTVAQQNREKAELELQNLEQSIIKNFPNGKAMLQLLDDVNNISQRKRKTIKF